MTAPWTVSGSVRVAMVSATPVWSANGVKLIEACWTVGIAVRFVEHEPSLTENWLVAVPPD
jgi:hypothetical protein